MTKRCKWSEVSTAEMHYHDTEWGSPSTDERYVFEMLCLETQQAGLSWRTVLEKRENYRVAFHNFEPKAILAMSEKEKLELYTNKGLIRNKLKIDSILNNARIVAELDGGLSNLIWSYVDHQPIINDIKDESEVLASSELSTQISKDLKKMGFKFVGPVTIYSWLQAIGIIDDHRNDCNFKSNLK